MIGSLVKKIFFKKSKSPEKTDKHTLVETLREKSQQLSDGIFERIDVVKDELTTMKYKYDNLLETNYNLGLKHIANGKLSEAIFRFRFIKKFWPQHYDSQYQLAYCLCLKGEIIDAQIALEEVLKKDPQHQAAKDLLALIESSGGTSNSDEASSS